MSYLVGLSEGELLRARIARFNSKFINERKKTFVWLVECNTLEKSILRIHFLSFFLYPQTAGLPTDSSEQTALGLRDKTNQLMLRKRCCL